MAVVGLYVLLVLKGHVGVPGVFRRDQPALGAAEFLVVVDFQPPQALAVGAGKAQHVGGHGAVGVVALVVVDEPHPGGDLVLLQKGVDGVPGVCLDLPFEHGVVGTAVPGHLVDGLLVHLQNLGEAPGHGAAQVLVVG